MPAMTRVTAPAPAVAGSERRRFSNARAPSGDADTRLSTVGSTPAWTQEMTTSRPSTSRTAPRASNSYLVPSKRRQFVMKWRAYS